MLNWVLQISIESYGLDQAQFLDLVPHQALGSLLSNIHAAYPHYLTMYL